MAGWWSELFVELPGIPSAEAFGTAATTPGSASVALTGIPSGEAFGTTTVIGPLQAIAMPSIPSAEAFGGSIVHPGSAAVGLFAKASDAAFGTMTVTRGPVTVAMPGIASGETFGALTVFKNPPQFGTVTAPSFGTGTLSWTHSMAEAGVIVVAVVSSSSDGAISGVTCDGSAMTARGSIGHNNTLSNGRLSLFSIAAAAGSRAIVASVGGFGWAGAAAISVTGVGSLATATTAYGNTTALQQGPLTVPPGGVLLQVFGRADNTGVGNLTGITGGTSQYNQIGGAGGTVGLAITTAPSTTTIAGTAASARPWSGIGLVINTT